jgi:NADH:ubiquinone oxidoreductase subunit 2 (subunit N)
MPRFGLVPALLAMFPLAAAAGRQSRWHEVAVLTLVMSGFAAAVFVYGLKLPYRLGRFLMGVIESLALGFQVALSAQNLAYCFAGVALGTLIGGAARHRPALDHRDCFSR